MFKGKKKPFQKTNIAGVESADKQQNKKDYTLAALGLMELLAKDCFREAQEAEGRLQRA